MATHVLSRCSVPASASSRYSLTNIPETRAVASTRIGAIKHCRSRRQTNLQHQCPKAKVWSTQGRRLDDHRADRLKVFAGDAAQDDGSKPEPQYRLPKGPEETVSQAKAALFEAYKDDIKYFQMDLLLPLIGATDLDDWPGGIRQQFKAAAPMLEDILVGLLSDLKVEESEMCEIRIMDQADAVGLWELPGVVTAVLFPTAETLPRIREIDEACDSEQPLILTNPQWQEGQLVSDFGIGPSKRKAEEFLSKFTTIYSLKTIRMFGENVSVHYRYPGKWQVFSRAEGSEEQEFIAALDEKPSYNQLKDLLKSREGSVANQNVFQRLISEFKFNADSLKQ